MNDLDEIRSRLELVETNIAMLSESINKIMTAITAINGSVGSMLVFAKNTNDRLERIEQSIIPMNLNFKAEDAN